MAKRRNAIVICTVSTEEKPALARSAGSDELILYTNQYFVFFFFFNDTATTEIYTGWYTLSLHDALPITPGIGLLWFALRREWRQLAIALGATAAVVAVSYALMPGAWREWIELLIANQGKGGTWAAIPIPLIVRGPIGVLLLVWGAPRNQRWVVPVAAMLA